MYMVLDKEKPFRVIRGLNLAAVMPTTVEVTNCSSRVDKIKA
jgi:hypothetical protein